MDIMVNTQDDAQVTEQELNLAARVSSFKMDLSKIRAARASAVAQMRGIINEIRKSEASQNTLLSQFQEEAYSMYPELAAKNLKAVIESTDSAHPLVQLWKQYEIILDSVGARIQSLRKDLDTALIEASKAEEMESQTLKMYESFEKGVVGKVPTVEQLISDLQVIEAIPKVEEGNVQMTDVPALERLSLPASNMVMLQAMETFKRDDYIDSDDLRDGEYTGPDTINKSALFKAPIVPFIPELNKKHLIMIIGGLSLAYVLFGGSDKK